MSWIAVLLIGLALGWALELILDIRFWGRRNRDLGAALTKCHSNLQTSENKIGETQAIVSLYQAKEDDYQKCQIDQAVLADKHGRLKTQIEKLKTELEISATSIEGLTSQVIELKSERDEIHNSLEAVDQWVETSMRQRIWDRSSLSQTFSRSKDKTVAYARTVTANATSRIGRTTGDISKIVSTGKNKLIQIRPKYWLTRANCAMWRLIGLVNKKATAPPSCSIATK